MNMTTTLKLAFDSLQAQLQREATDRQVDLGFCLSVLGDLRALADSRLELPQLLRQVAQVAPGTVLVDGLAYCATCHEPQPSASIRLPACRNCAPPERTSCATCGSRIIGGEICGSCAQEEEACDPQGNPGGQVDEVAQQRERFCPVCGGADHDPADLEDACTFPPASRMGHPEGPGQ